MSVDRLSRADIDRARARLLKMHFESGVGHIGGNLSALDALLVLMHECVRGPDMFVLSKGHAAGALYIALWSIGRVSEEDLHTFHGENTRFPGHPPAATIPEIRFATGSLGHGLSLAAGSALGFRLKGIDARSFCLTSDGEWQEGSTWEGLIFASHHRLGNLTILIDHNQLQGFGTTAEVASMSPLWEKLRGFDVDIDIVDGHDHAALRSAIAKRSDRPHCIILATTKGHGVSFMEGRMEWHYLPLTRELYDMALGEIGRM
ncbi:MAG TPA: transketolase [Candidatus Dormibacteraeota bacterium]|nr:transketolase [Candidatus Dormibacteraeota bacterium]